MDTRSNDRGRLYLCPTPIGNLGDITERTLETLKTADIIAAEDTRNTLKLLNHFGIRTPLTSYHEHNKYDKAAELVDSMLAGKTVACVTDAGTPAISDPGEVLVREAVGSGIDVISLPGATAFVTALTVSGLSSRRFVFEGFLPREKKERRALLEEIRNERRTMILYEAPHHLRTTLSELTGSLGEARRIALCRELTKLHEEILRMTLGEAVSYYKGTEPRGEFVLVIEGRPAEEIEEEKRIGFENISLEEHVRQYEALGIDRKEAMKKVAVERGIPKREVYKSLL
ncbi:MAG: 16S rRNA (cytidine(1402)-2'-O)-methyltransferase [Lachnospiraceae bacterium]|nr:16S rRNA (cytidine(1402)-2'-O)-methyltransferase [Lachnospiraceae bacterium]